PILQARPRAVRIMPLFFFAGVAAGVSGWAPGSSWGAWLLRRCTRLYRPVFYYLAFWTVALVVLRCLVPVDVYRPIAGISIQLLWFLGAYELVLAAVPLLARNRTIGQAAAAVLGVYGVVAAVAGYRLTTGSSSVLAFV